MTPFDLYVFALCFIVFALLTLLFSYLIGALVSAEVKMIRHGLLDDKLILEQAKKARKSPVLTWIGKGLSLLVCLLLTCMFAFAIYMNATEDRAANGIPSLRVVQSDSMSKKNKANTYLTENNLNDHLQTFDIIVCRHLPAEEDLKLFDIVVYKQDDIYVIHRIVGIEEPNEKHPDVRHFLLQGDAVDRPDRFPVLYSQMQGIYTGERIPFAGSFVMFLQSPAGWLAFLLVVYAMVATPLVERKLLQVTQERLQTMQESV